MGKDSVSKGDGVRDVDQYSGSRNWEGQGSLLWPHFAPKPSPGSFSGYHRGRDLNLPQPQSISCCCLPHLHLLCFAGDTDERRQRNGSPSPIHVPPSQHHAYIPIVPVQAAQACWGIPGEGRH